MPCVFSYVTRDGVTDLQHFAGQKERAELRRVDEHVKKKPRIEIGIETGEMALADGHRITCDFHNETKY